jgi:hypothetical protein
MAAKKAGPVTLGVLLIAIGAILLATRLAPIETAPAWLLGLGLAFALLAIFQRSYAALVAGMVLLGLGAGMVLGDVTAGGMPMRTWRLLGLGAGFLGIWVLGAVLQLKKHWWPLLAGGILVAVGAAPFLRQYTLIPPQVEILVRTWWPAALVIGGIAIVLASLRR